MKDLVIEMTQSTPYIKFSDTDNLLIIRGESFPENSAKFYAPVLEWIKEYISILNKQEVTIIFEIIYFNSSTSKVFMTIFEIMEEAVNNGRNITVNWVCDEKNETVIECGEEFKEDLSIIPFNIVLI